VVSEERGSMRIALGGRLGPDLNGTELREQLRALVYDRAAFLPPEPGPSEPDPEAGREAEADVPAGRAR